MCLLSLYNKIIKYRYIFLLFTARPLYNQQVHLKELMFLDWKREPCIHPMRKTRKKHRRSVTKRNPSVKNPSRGKGRRGRNYPNLMWKTSQKLLPKGRKECLSLVKKNPRKRKPRARRKSVVGNCYPKSKDSSKLTAFSELRQKNYYLY